MFIRLATLIALFLLTGFLSYSQSNRDTLLNKVDPQKFAAAIGKSADKLEDALVKKSMKVLDKMQKQETKIYKKLLSGKDSLQARAKLNELQGKYAAMKNNLKNSIGKAKAFLPHLDSLNTSLKFLDANGIGGKVKDALAKTNALQDKFQQAEEIKKFIRERREQLKQQLEGLGMIKQLKQINKQYYYYAAQLKEYREILKDPKKIEKKALEMLSKTSLFKEFMEKNSMLASLFRMPGDDLSSFGGGLAGLQTRVQVNNLIQQQLSSGGPGAMQQFRSNLQDAQGQLNQLKNKISQLGAGSSDAEMPEGFKPNDQKTRSFLKRLEYGTKMQSQSATRFFPVTSDIGLFLGYKLNDKSIIGIGVSYKMGWGRGWNNIRITNQGVGLRSFIDWKLKGNLFISGGYEQNHKTAFSDFDQLRDLNAWQTSGLIGLSKIISLKTKLFKKTKMQLLWDFLSYQQVPRTQAVIFRIGYNLK